MANKRNKNRVRIGAEISSPDFLSMHNIKIFTISLCSYLLLFWLFPIYSFIGLYAIVGIIIGATAKNNKDAVLLGLLIGILGGILSSTFLTTEKFIHYVQTMPYALFNKDIPLLLYTDVFYNIVIKNPIAYLGKPIYIILSISLMCTFSGLFSIPGFKKIKIYIFLFILCMNFLFVTLYIGKGLIEHTSVEPPNYSYQYDAYFYLKAAYLLDRMSFYPALITAFKYDGRVSKEQLAESGGDIMAAHEAHAAQVVEDGKWKIAGSAMYVRQPFIFYVWKYIGQGKMGRVVYAGILFSVFLMILSYFSAKKVVGDYAFIAPIIIMPYLFTGNTWINIFSPDWWAALFYLSGFLFWIYEKYWPSAFSFLFAAMSRGEVTLAVFLIFILFAIFKKKEAFKPFITVAIFFAIWFGIHLYRADPYIHPSAKAASSIGNYLLRFTRSLFTTGASYMMFLYGFFKIPAIIFPLIAIFVSFVKNQYALLAVSFYYIFHNAFHSSSYWGQHFTMIILITATFVFSINMKEIETFWNKFKNFTLKYNEKN